MAPALRRKERSSDFTQERPSPGTLAGIAGMVLVAALYVAHALLLKITGHGLGVPWLLSLVLPGALAARLSRKAGAHNDPEREGVRAGLLISHFATLLQVTIFVIGVLNVDWAAYNAQVGPEIGNRVHETALPATAVASVVLVAVTYTGCIFASWLGALAYWRITNYEL
jgi:hypothetical protein